MRVRGSICAVVAATAAFGVACRPDVKTVCPASFPMPGIGVKVDAPLALQADQVHVRFCQLGACVERTSPLHAPTSQVYARQGFADFQDITVDPAHVTLTFRKADGTDLATTVTEVVPELTYPQGPHCGATVFTRILVGGDGSVTSVASSPRAG